MTPALAIEVLMMVHRMGRAGLQAAPEAVEQAAVEWLQQNDLLNASRPLEWFVTDRGRAWLDMIEQTPLPIRAGWADPRFIEDSVKYAWKRDPPLDEPQAPYTPPSRAEMVAAATDLPVGFKLNPAVEQTVIERADDGTEISRKISLPPGVDARDAVVVISRAGKRRGEDGKLFAGSVRWTHTPEFPPGKAGLTVLEKNKATTMHAKVRGDDVMGFYVIEDPDKNIRGAGLVENG